MKGRDTKPNCIKEFAVLRTAMSCLKKKNKKGLLYKKHAVKKGLTIQAE